MIHAVGRPGAVHVLRLLPGEDLRPMLLERCLEMGIEAALLLGAVGSLGPAVLRFAGAEEGQFLEGDLELLSLSGTLSRHGVHLHALVSDGVGTPRGGHVMVGCLVRTTLEVVLQEIEGIRMERRLDPRTGHEELFPVAMGRTQDKEAG